MHTPVWAYFMFWGMVIFAAIGLACSSVMLLEWLDRCKMMRWEKRRMERIEQVKKSVTPNDGFKLLVGSELCAIKNMISTSEFKINEGIKETISKIGEQNNLAVGLGLGIKLIQEMLAKQEQPRGKKK